MAECDAQAMLNTAKCFSCLDSLQLRQITVVLLCNILKKNDPMAQCNVADLLDDAKCYQCLSEQQLSMLQTQLLCEILTGGGGGQGCLLCGAVDPTDEPECTCALYYNRTTSSFWYWDTVDSKWYPLIGGP